ncbi:MAG: hypothetical protein KGS72_24970 [Cyanobacteria bacterium REEB67]|nr:hypothetical protein [Cyanobacteria bacterium REEB67]
MNFTSRFLIGTLGAAVGAIIYQLITQPLAFGQFNFTATAAFVILLGPLYGLIYAAAHKSTAASVVSCILCGLLSTIVLACATWLAEAPDNKLSIEFTSTTLLALSGLSLITGLSAYAFTRNRK